MNKENFEKWAKYYDLMYKKYIEDINFYKKLAANTKGKVLELACGTGRIYLNLLEAGVDVYGVDISKNMLNVLKSKAKKKGLKPKVKKADMRNFKFDIKFSLIIIPFSSFLHILSQEDQIKTLKNIRKHLTKNGLFALDIFHPDPKYIVKNFNRERLNQVFKIGGQRAELWEKSYFIDEPNQIVRFDRKLKVKGRTIWKDSFTITLIYKKEFELLLRIAGFKRWKVYGGFDLKPFKSFKQKMVWIVKN